MKRGNIMNKIVFLDIDGVLNTQGDKFLIENTFEENKLKNFIKFLIDTNSDLVVISDRRLIADERLMIDSVFDKYLIVVNYLSFKRTHKKRSDEILYYLSNHKYINYVILDDNDLGYSEDNILKSHFVNTYINGFTKEEYNMAMEILNKNINYQLKINNEIVGIFSFKEAKEKALEEIHNHITSENQAFLYDMPFSAGANMNYVYDERLISDEEIVAFERIRMLLQDLISIVEKDKTIDYINKNYECHNTITDFEYDFYITNNSSEIILELNSDNDYLYTNMFNMIEGNEYYFNSRQEIVVKDSTSKRELGEIVKLEISLNPIIGG